MGAGDKSPLPFDFDISARQDLIFPGSQVIFHKNLLCTISHFRL